MGKNLFQLNPDWLSLCASAPEQERLCDVEWYRVGVHVPSELYPRRQTDLMLYFPIGFQEFRTFWYGQDKNLGPGLAGRFPDKRCGP